jgi:Type IV secretion system pilin
MIQKIKRYALMITTILTIAAPAVLPTMAASAACSNIGNQVAGGAYSAANNGGSTSNTSLCTSTSGVNQDSVGVLASKIVNIFSIVVGAVAVIMIIYGGFRYITSGGDTNKVGSAKNTLIYAIIGLIIVALAQVIVHFVLNTSSNAVTQA